jgi:CheY-like chemotaxis protein
VSDPAERASAAGPETARQVRVLVVEDSPINLLLIQAYLKGPPFQLDTASNGAAAVEKFQSAEYDIVLMDIQMPVMDGYTATRMIRAWEAQHRRRHTPILALTAYAFQEQQQQSFSAGCNAHLVKPVRQPELLEAIEAFACPLPAPPRATTPERIPVNAPEGVEEAVPLFLEITRADLQNLADALRASDYEKIRFIGHDLKGSGGGYGFHGISAIGKLIEEAAKRSDGEEVSRQVAALTDYLDRVHVIYP